MDWTNSATQDISAENTGLSQRLVDNTDASHSDRTARLAFITSVMRRSPSGRKLLEEAQARGVEIEITEAEEDYGGYTEATPWSAPTIRLNPDVSDARMIATLAHELRHSHHDEQSFMLGANRPPSEGLIVNRWSEADAEVAALVVCDELEEQGITSPMDQMGRLANAYRNMTKNKPETRTNGAAHRAIFNMWFTAKAQVATYDANVADFYKQNSLAVLNGRKSGYAASPTVDMARKTIGTLPNGVFYLADDPKMGPPLDDNFYVGKVAEDTKAELDQLERRMARPEANTGYSM